tara:strand:- start:375 stop:992 length:618 start_codon:yes stop_codon:yes gene_type:complete
MAETEGSDMPAWIPLATAGISALGGLMSSKKEASSASNAATIQARSAANTARIRADSDAAQLAYLRGESDLTRQQAEINRKANWGQWDTSESNIHNRTRDALLNTYGATTAQGLNATDLYNVGQGNIYDQWTTGRADTNLELARRDQRMSDLGVMLGSDPRERLSFRDDPTLRQATYTPGPRPIITEREKRPFAPSNLPTSASNA